MNINLKMILFIIIIPFLLLIGAGFFTFNQQQAMMEQQIDQRNLIRAEQLAESIYGAMREQKQTLYSFSTLPVVQEMIRIMPDSNRIEDFLALERYDLYLEITGAFAQDPKIGLIYCGSERSYNALANVWIDLNTRELSLGSQQILEAINSLTDITNRTKESVDEMLQSVQIVNESSRQVGDISGSVKMGMDEINQGTTEIADSMVHLQAVAMSISGSVQKMSAEIESFKT